ncbi:MAG: PAS domain-containing protein [Gammaproteobacteria bacterium]|nr:PAS domain-containing protein [Gammaproteobacteria bacterium]
MASPPQLADILGSVTTAIIGIDADGIVDYLNPGAEDLLSLSARHSIGRPLQALLPQLRNLHELVARAAAEGHSFGQLLSPSPSRLGPAANELAVRVSPSRAGDGRLVIEIFDATQWRQIDRERALISQHDASRRMIRQLAHEIRNPLGGLRGAAQLLERELPTPELREYTRIIIGEADRLTSLTDSLLGPIRRPQWRLVNLHEIIERVIVLIASEQRDAVRLVRDYDPSLPSLTADADQLLQSLLNVARNAMQAVGPNGQIVFRTRVLGNFSIGQIRHKLVASIEIEDDGPGIPPEIADSIFYPLVTGRPDGTGLGLPISQDLVSRHGGLIEFQSRPGKTVFMVRLPIHGDVAEMP